jgi:hypothetical protein
MVISLVSIDQTSPANVSWLSVWKLDAAALFFIWGTYQVDMSQLQMVMAGYS